MHSLPCASGGEDSVCVALTQLSKSTFHTLTTSIANFTFRFFALLQRLMEDNTNGLQAGGCDSSDCLFCQYRSNSPFHLNAYAGKLTSLLRKRSLNGMMLTSLNTRVDASAEQCAALPAISPPTVARCSDSKRHRQMTSTNGMVTASGLTPGLASEPFFGPPALTAVSGTTAPTAPHPHRHPLAEVDEPHDCLTMCGGRQCSDHILHGAVSWLHGEDVVPTTTATTGSAKPAEQPAPAPAMDPDSAGIEDNAGAGIVRASEAAAPTEVAAATVSGLAANAGGGLGTTLAPPLSLVQNHHPESRIQASVQTQQLLAHPRHQQAHCPLRPEQHQGRHKQQQGPPSEVHQQQGREAVQPSPPLPPLEQQQQQQRAGRLVCGRELPEGWSFQGQWRNLPDPVPATLKELVRLPGPSYYSRHGPGRRPPGCDVGPSGSACSGSAGIICALEFSPDGRLLAAAGVDKQ
ncbi:hypothetical protein VOLCADRAFT_116893, partial [Volvox carteri f. nagariensis]